jgi:hypothetical protein
MDFKSEKGAEVRPVIQGAGLQPFLLARMAGFRLEVGIPEMGFPKRGTYDSMGAKEPLRSNARRGVLSP